MSVNGSVKSVRNSSSRLPLTRLLASKKSLLVPSPPWSDAASSTRSQGRGRPIVDEEDDDVEFDEKEEEFVVEGILEMRIVDGKRQYLLKWKGYPTEEATWEPEEHCTHCFELIQEFHRRCPVPNGNLKEDSASNRRPGRASSVASGGSRGIKRKSATVFLYSGRESKLAKVNPSSPLTTDCMISSVSKEESPRRVLDTIHTVHMRKGKLVFEVTWKGESATAFEDANFLNEAFPQKVIEFYESRIKWHVH